MLRVARHDQFRENLSAEARQELATKDAGSSRVPDSPGWQVHVGNDKLFSDVGKGRTDHHRSN